MQIVIDIDDNEYLGIKNYPDDITSYPVTIHLYKAVRNGTPLKPKTGHWIYQKGYVPYKWKCNQCSAEFKIDFHFCPNCGAKMESEEEDGNDN